MTTGASLLVLRAGSDFGMADPTPSAEQKCPVCDDDGWIDIDDEDGFPIGARECPRLHEPGHAEFNATGLLSV